MKIINFFLIFIIIYISLLIFSKILFDSGFKFKTKQSKPSHKPSSDSGKCDPHSCGALDPVSDPVYNMQQIVKQSILLEEHLTNKNKRCRDCITKHFLHIIGLAEEAQMLATKNSNNYPLLNENVDVYNKLFKKWFDCYKDMNEEKILIIVDELRNNRKKLIAIYFYNDTSVLT